MSLRVASCRFMSLHVASCMSLVQINGILMENGAAAAAVGSGMTIYRTWTRTHLEHCDCLATTQSVPSALSFFADTQWTLASSPSLISDLLPHGRAVR